MMDDRQTDHTTEKCVAIGRITCARAILANNGKNVTRSTTRTGTIFTAHIQCKHADCLAAWYENLNFIQALPPIVSSDHFYRFLIISFFCILVNSAAWPLQRVHVGHCSGTSPHNYFAAGWCPHSFHVVQLKLNSPDNSPDEASPGGLARPLESIGRGSSKERLIIVVHPL